MVDEQWKARVAAVWAAADSYTDSDLVAAIDALAAEHPDDPIALYEAGGARDSTGQESAAEPLYRRAIDAGLQDPELSQVTIQLASTVRNLGRPLEAADLLNDHFGGQPDHPLAGAAAAFLALALHDAGRPTEAVSVAVKALAATLPRYQRSAAAYADELEPPLHD